MIFWLVFFVTSYSSFSINSCEDKLKRRVWPLDCFLSANIQKKDENSKFYMLLNEWCTLYSDDLLLSEPPEALFTLKIPKNCKKIAIKSKRHHESLKLLRGDFLNSFL